MNTNTGFRLSLLAGAVLAAFIPQTRAAGEGEDITALTKPGSAVSAGVGFLSDDGPRFGQYTGVRKDRAYLLLDGDYRRRNDATGTWLNMRARNLGLESGEVRIEHNRQGNWGYFLEYGETPRFEPRTAVTGLTGIGSASQTINGTGLRPVNLKMKRETLTLGYDKTIAGNFEFQFRFRNEEKNGARLFGQGNGFAPIDTRFLTDPIDYTTRQWEAIAGYNTDRLQLSAGYYGTSFDNDNPALNVAGAIVIPGAGGGPLTPMAMPPGNQSHQLYLTGGYNLTPATRASFKVAYAQQTQDENFVAAAANGRTNLGGKVATTLAQVGLTARPLDRLSLLANLRYEDRDDKTPVALYFTGATPASTLDGFNEPRSIKTVGGKAEASYQLPVGFRLTGGLDYEKKERNTFRVRSVSHRDETEELASRVELRRSIGESVTGALAYVHSERDGSPFLTTVVNSGAVGSNLIAPLHLADRDRDKVRASINWMPTDPLNIQFFIEEARDKYSARTAANLGVRSGRARNYTVDAGYTFSEAWQANAYYTLNDTRAEQASQTGVTQWGANNRNDSDTLGFGMHGKPMAKLEVGADLQYSRIVDKFGLFTITGPAVAAPLPEIHTRITSLKLFAKYAVQNNAGVRLNYIYDSWRSDDFTWSTFVYTDGTRIQENPSQKVHFIGISGYYQWR